MEGKDQKTSFITTVHKCVKFVYDCLCRLKSET